MSAQRHESTAALERLLAPLLGQPLIAGEYPYYRDDPNRWAAKLQAIKATGVNVISCYIPWRHHCSNQRGGFVFDSSSAERPSTNVTGFLKSVSDLGLLAIVKPGPFVHAEIQCGGLPDYAVPSFNSSIKRFETGDGCALLSQQHPLPSTLDPAFWGLAHEWLTAVNQNVIEPLRYPHGPIIGVQLGNEGLYSDFSLPLAKADVSQPVRAAIESRGSRSHSGRSIELESFRLAIAKALSAVSTAFPDDLPRLVNFPLPAIQKERDGALASWILRVSQTLAPSWIYGYTSWRGPVFADRYNFLSYLIALTVHPGLNVEENWGFTWDYSSYETALPSIQHMALGLAYGANGASVYTACSTDQWDNVIDLDRHALIAEGKNPKDYGPPYCPFAPIDTDGAATAKAAELKHFVTAVAAQLPHMRLSKFVPHVSLVIDKKHLIECIGFGDTAALEAELYAAISLCLDMSLTFRICVADEIDHLPRDAAKCLALIGWRRYGAQKPTSPRTGAVVLDGEVTAASIKSVLSLEDRPPRVTLPAGGSPGRAVHVVVRTAMGDSRLVFIFGVDNRPHAFSCELADILLVGAIAPGAVICGLAQGQEFVVLYKTDDHRVHVRSAARPALQH